MRIKFQNRNEQSRYRQVEIGIVIPIYQEKFIIKLIKQISKLGSKRRFIICIVNDGVPQLAYYLNNCSWPDNVIILNLPENKQFAGANNAGWAYLTHQFPTIKYLGTLNDDTIPQKDWLDELVEVLEKYPQSALAGPIMETPGGRFGSKKRYAVWQYSTEDTSAECIKSDIKNDEFVSFVSGFCFIARREDLEEIGGFDERFKNSCEDVDICLKLIKQKRRIVVASKSVVFHWGGSSRYIKGTNTDLDKSHLLLAEKWGRDLSPYNDLAK